MGFTATPTRYESIGVPPMKYGYSKNGAVSIQSAFGY